MTSTLNMQEKLAKIIKLAADKNAIKKAVFSKPNINGIVKANASLRLHKDNKIIQIEYFTKDNKAMHKNISLSDETFERDMCGIVQEFMQVNVITTCGDCEYKCSKSGNSTIISGDKLISALEKCSDCVSNESLETNNNRKNYILTGDEPFLKLLGVSDKNGRIHDKKQSKFRQINRFLEHVRDVLKYLPEGDIRICDLCCGKSYLSFAIYHYFANILHRNVSMTGVDLKADVVEYCNDVSQKLQFDGLEFLCMDITKYVTDKKPDLVVSLHACDIATDIVLKKAMDWNAKVILSTPCCHHELNHKIKCKELEFITKYSMLRQKLCDAATDALRLKLLESKGYITEALELIDPEETPKNIMLRAIRKKGKLGENESKAALEYENIKTFLIGNDSLFIEGIK